MFFLKGFIDFLTIYFRRPKFAFMVILMIFTGCVVSAVFGVRVVTDIPVYVVDHDNSTISRSLRLFLDSGPDLKVLGTLDSLDEIDDIFFEGKAAAVVYIPAGTSEAVKTQKGAHIFGYIDGTNMLMAKNADKAIQTVVKTASVGVSMIAIQKQGMPKQALMGALQPINLDVEKPFNALVVYSEYLLPVLIFFMLNIFTCVMTCACFQEKLPKKIKSHTLRRRFFYLGRLCAVFLIALIVGALIYQYGLPRIEIILQSAPLMALSSLVIYLVLTIMLFSTINLMMPIAISMSLSYLICMLSVMFSGLTWPLEMMPWYISGLAKWIPLTPFLQSVQVFLYHDATWSDLWTFFVMFIKQAILYTCLIFIIMRMRDIRLIFKWAFYKIKHQTEITPSLEMAAAAASPKLSSAVLKSISSENNPSIHISKHSTKPVSPSIIKDNTKEDISDNINNNNINNNATSEAETDNQNIINNEVQNITDNIDINSPEQNTVSINNQTNDIQTLDNGDVQTIENDNIMTDNNVDIDENATDDELEEDDMQEILEIPSEINIDFNAPAPDKPKTPTLEHLLENHTSNMNMEKAP